MQRQKLVVTFVVLLETLMLQNMLYLILSRFPVSLPLYRYERSTSPASIISLDLLAALSLLKISMFFLKCSFSLSTFSGDHFPIPNRLDVVSHPATACIKSILLRPKLR